MIRKRVSVVVLMMLFIMSSTVMITVGIQTNVEKEKKEEIKIDNEYFISLNEGLDIGVPSYSVVENSESYKIYFNEINSKATITKKTNDGLAINKGKESEQGFNPALDEALVWFQEYDKNSNYIHYLWLVQNKGDTYVFEQGVTYSVTFYGISNGGTEQELWSNIRKSNDKTTWEKGDYRGWIFYLRIVPDWGKTPQIKAVFEITYPEESPDVNLEDNVLIVPFTDCIEVNAQVQNLSGNPVKEAEVMHCPLENHGFWFGGLTDEKGNCVVPIPPKEPLNEALTYKLYADKSFNPFHPDDSQNKTTDPVKEGQETDLEFEIEAEGEKSKPKIRQKNFFLDRFPIIIKIIQRFLGFTGKNNCLL